MPLVFSFDHKHRQAPMEKKDLLGGKGANLAEMTSVLGLPVPPGFTITTDACRAYLDGGWPASLDDEVAKAVRKVEKAMGKKLGDPGDPLLVSVRSGAKFSMPGMMDTVLNLGLNDESVEGLAAQTGDARFAYDSYRRFISMYGRIVLDLEGARLRPAARQGQGEGRRHRRRQGVGRRRSAASASSTRTSSRRPPASRSRRTRSCSSAARSRRCSRAGAAPAPSPTASASASRTTSAPR